MAAMVQFDVVAADMTLAQAYSAAVTQNLPGQAMLSCLKVGTLLCVMPQVSASEMFELTADCLHCVHGYDDRSSKWLSTEIALFCLSCYKAATSGQQMLLMYCRSDVSCSFPCPS